MLVRRSTVSITNSLVYNSEKSHTSAVALIVSVLNGHQILFVKVKEAPTAEHIDHMLP